MQQQVIQNIRNGWGAIAVATKGRKSYANGMPRGFASSNHYGYHGDLAALLAVIEGEPGFDQTTWDGIVQVLRDYWEIGYTPFGASREDGYGPNLGLRGGGRGLMVLARRGYNIFATEKFRNYLNYVAMEYDPYPGGHLNGGASGGPYGELYPTSTLISRYMYLTFDARPDAHLIGHDKVDRGNFSMSALGRVWAFSGDFYKWNLSRENSLVHIDGKAQAWKAPGVRMLWNEDTDAIAGAAADLKYAYDWEWTPPWPKWGREYDAPWEPETRTAVDLGWPTEYILPEFTAPIHGSETG